MGTNSRLQGLTNFYFNENKFIIAILFHFITSHIYYGFTYACNDFWIYSGTLSYYGCNYLRQRNSTCN